MGAEQQDTRLPSAEQIAERIRHADEARIEQRADAARKVAELAGQLDEVRERLAAVTEQLGGAVARAVDVLTLDELRGFTERGASELNEWARAGGVPESQRIAPGRKRSARTDGTRKGKPSGGGARSRSATKEQAATARPSGSGETDEAASSGAGSGGHEMATASGEPQRDPAAGQTAEPDVPVGAR